MNQAYELRKNADILKKSLYDQGGWGLVIFRRQLELWEYFSSEFMHRLHNNIGSA